MNKIVKSIFDLYIFLNIHVALSIALLYYIFNQFYFQKNYFLFLFFSTIFSYGMIRLMFLENNRDSFLQYFYRFKKIFIGTIILSFLFSLYFFFKLPIYLRFSILPLGVITFFYQSDFSFFSFRQNGILKIITVAFVWAMLIVTIPELYLFSESSRLKLKFIFVFFYILLLTLSFDQRDILIDRRELGTIPQLFPQYKFYFYTMLGIILSVLSFLLFDGYEIIIAEGIVIISLLLSWFSDDRKSFYYTSFIIEGIPVLWAIIILAIKKGLL